MTVANHYITHAPATVNRNADQPGNPRSNLTDQPGNPRHPSPTVPDLSAFGNSRQGRLLAGHIRSCLPYPPRHGGLGWFPGYANFHVVGNDQLFRRVEPEDVHRRWRATP